MPEKQDFSLLEQESKTRRGEKRSFVNAARTVGVLQSDMSGTANNATGWFGSGAAAGYHAGASPSSGAKSLARRYPEMYLGPTPLEYTVGLVNDKSGDPTHRLLTSFKDPGKEMDDSGLGGQASTESTSYLSGTISSLLRLVGQGSDQDIYKDGLLKGCLDPWPCKPKSRAIALASHVRAASTDPGATDSDSGSSVADAFGADDVALVYPVMRPRWVKDYTLGLWAKKFVLQLKRQRQKVHGEMTARFAEDVEGTEQGSRKDKEVGMVKEKGVVFCDKGIVRTEEDEGTSSSEEEEVSSSNSSDSSESSEELVYDVCEVDEESETEDEQAGEESGDFVSWRENCSVLLLRVYSGSQSLLDTPCSGIDGGAGNSAVEEPRAVDESAETDANKGVNGFQLKSKGNGDRKTSALVGTVKVLLRDLISSAKARVRSHGGTVLSTRRPKTGEKEETVYAEVTKDHVELARWFDVREEGRAKRKKSKGAVAGQVLLRMRLDYKRHSLSVQNITESKDNIVASSAPGHVTGLRNPSLVGVSEGWWSLALKEAMSPRVKMKMLPSGINAKSALNGTDNSESGSGESGAVGSSGKRQGMEESQGSTIGTIMQMPENVKNVQNLMADILDMVESVKNVLNWTLPSKTFPLLWLLLIALIVCILIPNRYLVLAIGLQQFTAVFIPSSRDPDTLPSFSVQVFNLLSAVPNDLDLETSVYHMERAAYARRTKAYKKNRINRAKRGLALPCFWEEGVEMKMAGVPMGCTVPANEATGNGSGLLVALGGYIGLGMSTSEGRSHAQPKASMGGDWSPAYLAVQGRRLAWWDSEWDLVDGNRPPSGILLLHGHAGSSDCSPVEKRDVGPVRAARVVTIFGLDCHGMHLKCTVLCATERSCEALRALVDRIVEEGNTE